MNTFRQVRTAALVAGVAVLALQGGAAAAQTLPEPQELSWAVGEQPEAALSRTVLESAGAYQKLVAARTARGPVMRASNLKTEQLFRGAAAYAATVALKDPDFAASVQWLASDPMARKRIAACVLQNPEYAARCDPTGATAARIEAALTTDASPALAVRAMAVAALAVLGEAGDANAAAVEALLAEPGCGAGECVYAAR